MENKKWRTVPGFNGRYEISIEGDECLCRNAFTGTILSNHQGKNRYIQWHLYKDGKNISRQAARWIAFTYPELVENEYFEGAEIDHKDTNTLNNHPSNLRWVSSIENKHNPYTEIHRKNATKTGEEHHWYGKHHTEETKAKMRASSLNCESLSKPVAQYTLDGVLVKIYPSTHQAARETGLFQANISACCLNRINTDKYGRTHQVKSAGGYVWKYINN